MEFKACMLLAYALMAGSVDDQMVEDYNNMKGVAYNDPSYEWDAENYDAPALPIVHAVFYVPSEQDMAL